MGECLPQLLYNPQAGGMPSHVEIWDTPPIVADDEEAVEHAERYSGDGEEVHRSDGFSMIAQKGEPTFGRLGISRCSPHPIEIVLSEILTPSIKSSP